MLIAMTIGLIDAGHIGSQIARLAVADEDCGPVGTAIQCSFSQTRVSPGFPPSHSGTSRRTAQFRPLPPMKPVWSKGNSGIQQYGFTTDVE
jgi:hypothetical protein